MKFGLDQTIITPETSVFMHGFGARNRKSEGVHDDLYAKAVLLEGDGRLLILTLDVLGSDHSFTEAIKETLRLQFGLTHDEVLINYSHTHASVFLTGPIRPLQRGDYSIAQADWPETIQEVDLGEDEKLYVRIEAAVVDMVRNCTERLAQGRLSIAVGQADLAIVRRVPHEDGAKWQPNYEAPYDRDLIVLKLTDERDQVRGILYNYGCHPTAIGSDNYLFSGDFVGAASAALEAEFPGATAVFLQGCAGELKPLGSAVGDRFKSCSFDEADSIGRELAAEVVRIINEASFTPIACRFKSALAMPQAYTEPIDIGYYEGIVNDEQANRFMRFAAKRTLQAIEAGTIRHRLPLYIAVWHLDEMTRVIAIEGEVSTEYALLLKRMYPEGNTIVLGYTNAVYCYIPTRKMLGEGGYEAECNYFFGLRGPFTPEIEEIIVGQIAKLELELSGK